MNNALYIKHTLQAGLDSRAGTSMTKLVSLLGAWLVLLAFARANEKSYNVELNSFEMNTDIEDDSNWIDWGDLRMKKVSKNKFVVTGSFEFKRNMGNEQKVS